LGTLYKIDKSTLATSCQFLTITDYILKDLWQLRNLTS